MRPFLCGIYVSCLLGAAALVACSGATDTGLFGLSDDDGGGGDGEGSRGRDAALDGNRRWDSGLTRDAWGGPDGGFGDPDVIDRGDTLEPSFGCGRDDAGVPLGCAGTLCCANQLYDPFTGGRTSYACVASASSCASPNQGVIRCHNPGDCGGQPCCGDFDGTRYLAVACSITCVSPDSGTSSRIRFCDPGLGSADCDVGMSCLESGVLTGFYRCSR